MFQYNSDTIFTSNKKYSLDASDGGICSNETKRFQIGCASWNGVAADHGQSARRASAATDGAGASRASSDGPGRPDGPGAGPDHGLAYSRHSGSRRSGHQSQPA